MGVDEPVIHFILDGSPVVAALGVHGGPTLSLLDVLRDQLRCTAVKDGCSPQGQCGCCTVLVDGQARVACVTPVRRVAGRRVTTLEGLDPDRRVAWGDAFCASGASQCGFCTPGIVVRLDAVARALGLGPSSADAPDDSLGPAGPSRAAAPAGASDGTVSPEAALPAQDPPFRPAGAAGPRHLAVEQALLAHLCRCTGWQTIVEAWDRFTTTDPPPSPPAPRDLAEAAERARLEGGTVQLVAPRVALGRGGFASDTAPEGALVALPDGTGGWVVGETLAEARSAQHKVQGRRTTVAHSWPLEVPDGDWAATLRTTWVEPAYLEPDASWCRPGGEPASAVANGGAFGSKVASPVQAAARALADRHGRPVLVLASREDVTRWGPKRPPVAGGIRPDGTGLLRVVATPGIAAAVAAVAPGLRVEEVTVAGPPTSAAIRAAGWAEALVLLSAVGSGSTSDPTMPGVAVRAPNGARAAAVVQAGRIRVTVRCGRVLDDVVLRSYCIGAAHMAWSWVTSEALTVDGEGQPADLTIRSFGVVRAVDTPAIEVVLDPDDGADPVNGSDAVFAAVAAATWRTVGYPGEWPTGPPPGGW